MKKIIKILLCLSMFFTVAGCSKKYEKFDTTFTGPFDTVITFMAYAENQKAFDKYVDIVKEQFTYLDQLFDKYTSYEGINNIKTINDQAGIAPVEVDPLIVNLIDTWMNDYNDYSSKVDIALGPVLELWHDARENAVNENGVPVGVPPTLDELEAAYQYCNPDYIVVDTENNTVFLTDANASLDVGAIAKGYATEYIKDLLIEKGCESFLISAGGNVASHGTRLAKADGVDYLERSKNEFTVAIQSPGSGADVYTNNNYVAILIAEDKSIVTSGDYERYFYDEAGNLYSHLIDSSTLYPATYFRSVTVVTEDSGFADFMSTTLFLMDYDSGRDLVDSLDNVEAIWLMNDGTLIATDGLVSGDNFYSLIS